MRRSEQEQKRRLHRETDTPNVGTSRNSRRSSAKGNPIQVPSNSYAEVNLINKLSQKQKIIGNMHTKNQSRRAEKFDKPNPQPTRASSRIVPSKKKEDVIEIDSDPENHFVEPEIMVPEEKPRKRRLIQQDPEESAQDIYTPSRFPRRKTANSPLNVTPSRSYNSSQLYSTRIQSIMNLTKPPADAKHFLENFIENCPKPKEPKFDLAPLMLQSRMKVNETKEKPKKFGEKYVIGEKSFYPEDDDFKEEKNSTVDDASKIGNPTTDAVKKQLSPISSPAVSPSVSPSCLTRQVTKKPLPSDPIDDYEIEPTGPDEHILNYPFNKKKSITVYERDFERLEDETYLNDTLIDVFPKIWADEYPEASIYTFSSFFFTKLSGPYSTIHYDTVQRWTSSIDIFKKDYIIIPVAQNNHWFILLVVNPGYCIQGTKGLNYHDNFPDLDKEEIPVKSSRKKTISAGTTLNTNKPYIMALDPLGLNKQTTAKCVLQYLKKEAITKLNIEESDFLAPEIVMTPCPGQDNFTDCGVFCLHYMKSLYQYPDIMMDVLYKNQKNDEKWDMDDTIGNFRCVLKRLLKKKMKDYRELMFSELLD